MIKIMGNFVTFRPQLENTFPVVNLTLEVLRHHLKALIHPFFNSQL